MLRTPLLTVALLLTACGIDPAGPSVAEAPLVAATPAPAGGQGERLEVTELTAPARLAQLRPVDEPAGESVVVHSLAVPDGTQVRYLLGVMSCGILVVAQGTASVQAGAFEIPYQPADAQLGQVSLFFQLGAAACDPETSQVFEVPASLPGSVDLGTLPSPSYVGCWVFDLGG